MQVVSFHGAEVVCSVVKWEKEEIFVLEVSGAAGLLMGSEPLGSSLCPNLRGRARSFKCVTAASTSVSVLHLLTGVNTATTRLCGVGVSTIRKMA